MFVNLLFQIHCPSVVCFHCLQLRLLSHQMSSDQHQLSACAMQVSFLLSNRRSYILYARRKSI